ncbi:unnamed protein product, partial [Discosporangium mesarthrocarpum]
RAGGAVYWDNYAQDDTKALNITGCKFSNNVLQGGEEDTWGGAVLSRWGRVYISSSTFLTNSAANGAAVAVQQGQLKVKNSEFIGNDAKEYGGALVQTLAGTMDIEQTIFQENVAGLGGGAVAVATYAASDRYTITDTTFSQNTAGLEGGGAFYMLVDTYKSTSVGGTMTFQGTAFESNMAMGPGDNVNIKCGSVVVEGSDAVASATEEDPLFVIAEGYEGCSSLNFTLVSSTGHGPRLARTQFSDTGTHINLLFDSPTDFGAVGSLDLYSFSCPLLLSYPSSSDLDLCSWTSDSSVSLSLHNNATVAPGDNIVLHADKVASANALDFAASSVSEVLAPQNPPTPKLALGVMYSSVAYCENITVDASATTGSGGRDMVSFSWDLYDWTHSDEEESVAAELLWAQAASEGTGSSLLFVPGGGDTGALGFVDRASHGITLRFNVTATNWLGVSGWSTFEVIVSKSSNDPPLVSLLGGPSRTITRSSPLVIVALAQATSCASTERAKSTQLSYEWAELRHNLSFGSISQDPSFLRLSSHVLKVGNSYEFRVNVTDKKGQSSIATQVVFVEQSELIAAVYGGNNTVTFGENATLDLSASNDPDMEDGSCQGCLFTLSCGTSTKELLCGDIGLPSEEFSDKLLIVGTDVLELGESLILEIRVRRSGEDVWFSTTTFLTVVELVTPIVSITPVVGKVNADDTVTILAEVLSNTQNNARAEWTLSEGVLLPQTDDLGLVVDSGIVFTVPALQSIPTNIVFRKNVLVPGSTYTFALSASYVVDDTRRLQAGEAIGSADMTFIVNTPPTSGGFVVSPSVGEKRAGDRFLLQAFEWEDDFDDLPLLYMFAYVSGSANASDVNGEVIIRPSLLSSEASDAFLPQGYGSQNELVTSVYITDQLGAASRVTQEIFVFPYAGGVADLANTTGTLLAEALEAGETDTVIQVVGVVNSALNAPNCTEAPDCEALGRFDCGSGGLREDNTCGECLDDYVGTFGTGLTACVNMATLSASCANGVLDNNETSVDCGGSCPPCPAGSLCLSGNDCTYGNCLFDTYSPSSSPSSLITSEGQIGVCDQPPPKSCPNSCGGQTRGFCSYYPPSNRGKLLNESQCLADAPASSCLASCVCMESYGGDACQYTLPELEAAKQIRSLSLRGLKQALEQQDLNTATLAQQSTVLAKVTTVPEELSPEILVSALELVMSISEHSDTQGKGILESASSALFEVVGQLVMSSATFGEPINMTSLSAVIGSVMSSQVVGMVPGQNNKVAESDFFRASTGVYDGASIGGVEVSPPLTLSDLRLGRAAPKLTFPKDIPTELTEGVGNVYVGVAEWVIDPRQTSLNSSDRVNSASSILRLFIEPVLQGIEEQRRQLGIDRKKRRSLLSDLDSLEVSLPNNFATEWEDPEVLTFNHTCHWGSYETFSSVCPNGTVAATQCDGVNIITCTAYGTEPQCANWRGSEQTDDTFGSACKVSSYSDNSTTCLCNYGDVIRRDGIDNNQVDFGSLLVSSSEEFASIWSTAESLTWRQVNEAWAIFVLMGAFLGVGILCMWWGWLMDLKDMGLPSGICSATCSALQSALCCYLNFGSRKQEPVSGALDVPQKVPGQEDTSSRANDLVVRGAPTTKNYDKPHHLGDPRLLGNFKLLLMLHHDFISVFFFFSRWFTRPQRVAYLLTSLVTLMAADATVFSVLNMDDAVCSPHRSEDACVAQVTGWDSLGAGAESAICTWDVPSSTCHIIEVAETFRSAIVISTVTLIFSVPLDLVVLLVFVSAIARPTKCKGKGKDHPNSSTAMQKTSSHILQSTHEHFHARFQVELALARNSTQESQGLVRRFFKGLVCCCCHGDGASGSELDGGISDRVMKDTAAALVLEKELTNTNGHARQEALLFEVAQVDSLTHFERQVFLKTRILDIGDSDPPSPVSWWYKDLAWILVGAYVGGLAFYVCLFGIRNNRQVTMAWMTSFWAALTEDIIVLIPLKLALVFLYVPSLMRYRMQPAMFRRIPRHAPSVQIARRRPDLKVVWQ